MAKIFLSASLGVALALSSVSTGFAATTTGGLANTLSGQPGVTSQLMQAVSNVQLQCETSGIFSGCRAALDALLAATPQGLSPTLVNEINELVTTVSAGLPTEGQTGAVPGAAPGGAGADPAGGGTTAPNNYLDSPGDGAASPGA
ncbi:MAG: hypothetical protein H6Q99_1629 [Proteobacteria bacterium]|nr:hypothetical protein [Pseudomonadota bacterium]